MDRPGLWDSPAQMKRIIAAVAIAAALTLTMAPAAEAAPRFGRRHTASSGYIVWVRGDSDYARVHCSWYANSKRWKFSWLIRPHEYKWTTSDSGAWGDYRPTQLDCTYHRA